MHGGVVCEESQAAAAPRRRQPGSLKAPLRPFRLGESSGNEPYNGVFGGGIAAPSGGFAVLADELWGVARLNLATGRISNLALGPMKPWRRETSGPPRTLALLRDRAGRVWVGGAPGLFRVGADFASVARVVDNQPDWPLHKLDISGLAEDPATGALWLSTNGGLFWLPPPPASRPGCTPTGWTGWARASGFPGWCRRRGAGRRGRW